MHGQGDSYVTHALEQNGYCSHLVHKTVLLMCHTSYPQSPPGPQQLVATVTLPYVQGLPEPINWVLGSINIKVCFRPNQTLHRLLVRPKDLVPQDARRGVVYRIPCKYCNRYYVGQLKRSLATPVK